MKNCALILRADFAKTTHTVNPNGVASPLHQINATLSGLFYLRPSTQRRPTSSSNAGLND